MTTTTEFQLRRALFLTKFQALVNEFGLDVMTDLDGDIHFHDAGVNDVLVVGEFEPLSEAIARAVDDNSEILIRTLGEIRD